MVFRTGLYRGLPWFTVDFGVESRTRAHGEAIEALPSHLTREVKFPSAAPAVGGSEFSRLWHHSLPSKTVFLFPRRQTFFSAITA
jgi:hypothetical protein